MHQQQVVYRHLKPSNVMITHNGGYVKIIDFRLADTDSHTILKQPAGTLRYMAPEQAQLAQADVRNDIYSLGVIMQEMNRMGHVVCPRESSTAAWHPSTSGGRTRKTWLRRRRLPYIIAVAALVAVVIGLLVAQIFHLQQKATNMEGNAAEMSRQLRILRHEIIDFDDATVKHLCVAHWDIDHDGELSYDEAAASSCQPPSPASGHGHSTIASHSSTSTCQNNCRQSKTTPLWMQAYAPSIFPPLPPASPPRRCRPVSS